MEKFDGQLNPMRLDVLRLTEPRKGFVLLKGSGRETFTVQNP